MNVFKVMRTHGNPNFYIYYFTYHISNISISSSTVHELPMGPKHINNPKLLQQAPLPQCRNNRWIKFDNQCLPAYEPCQKASVNKYCFKSNEDQPMGAFPFYGQAIYSVPTVYVCLEGSAIHLAPSEKLAAGVPSV